MSVTWGYTMPPKSRKMATTQSTAVPESVKVLIALHRDDSPIRVRCAAAAVNNLCAHLDDSQKADIVGHINKELNNVV